MSSWTKHIGLGPYLAHIYTIRQGGGGGGGGGGGVSDTLHLSQNLQRLQIQVIIMKIILQE